ncbi:ceramide synthase 4-like, partial [Notechis scutatus]|uniref:Ceramide synthase 4-like n=1 Tax=Notechis scutatus TaxID=8663 RepID=A0A6J1VQG6_9SAUR
MAQLTQWLLRQEYWLPSGITWEDMEDTEDVHYPKPHHLLFSLPITLLLVTLRFLFDRKIAIPLSKKLGLQEKVRWKPSPNPILEAFYTKWRKNPQKEEVSGLAKQCDLQPRQVERWFRYRLNQNRPSLTKKFCEASWRTVHSLIFILMGLAVLYDKPWFWNIRECWVGYPLKPLHLSLYGYYLLQFSLYLTLVISMPFDVKQKDFNMMIVHHVISMLLIGFSYCVNFIPIGSLVMILQDAPDTPMYAAKVFKYLKWQKTCNTLFIIFSVVFLFNRAIVFPYKILYSTFYHLAEAHEPYFGYYFFNALLMLVYVLNVLWSCVIILMLYRFLIHGKLEKDARSDSESSEEDDVDEEEDVDEVDQKAKQKHTQNKTAPLSRNCTRAGLSQRGGGIMCKNYQQFLSLVFAVTEVNKDLVLLPNITLGFHIYDNHQIERTISITSLSLLSTQGQMVPGYKCDKEDPLLSVIGGHNPKTSRQMSSIFSTFKIPQLFPYLKNVKFNNSAGDEVSFLENGRGSAGYDILNWIFLPNCSFIPIKVGEIDPGGLDFTINSDTIVWATK